jgi:hypothetical protein
MFRTYEHDLEGRPGMFGEGQAHWTAVSRVLRTHWYHVVVEAQEGGRAFELELMINDEYRLREVIKSQEKGIVVKSVRAITPPRINGGSDWRMDRLASVSVGEDADDIPVCLMQLENGSVYHDSFQKNFDPSSLSNLRQMYVCENQ